MFRRECWIERTVNREFTVRRDYHSRLTVRTYILDHVMYNSRLTVHAYWLNSQQEQQQQQEQQLTDFKDREADSRSKIHDSITMDKKQSCPNPMQCEI